MDKEKIQKNNRKILMLLSTYLNNNANAIKESNIEIITKLGFDRKYAYALLLASFCGLHIDENNEDKEFFNEYFLPMIIEESIDSYRDNLYFKNIHFNNHKINNWEIKEDYYAPFTAFVRDDMITYSNGKVLPQIGYFPVKYTYLAVYENKRLWMSITPNEINTMRNDINDAHGDVLALGLGLGYFIYMVSMKEDVKSVTVCEKDKNVIKLFKNYILPQFTYIKKITIIEEDAFIYCERLNDLLHYDYIFCDLWHDVSDGLPLYKKLKRYEEKNQSSIWRYWIEKTMKCYIRKGE